MVRRLSFVALLSVAALLMGAGATAAHSSLVSSSPAEGETLTTAPAQVELVFDQTINSSFLTVAITDESGKRFDDNSPAVDEERVRVKTTAAMTPGRYTVAYRVISADGHPITGSYSFTLLGSSTTTAAPTSTPAPTATAAPQVPADDNGAPVSLFIAIIVVGILGVLGLGWILIRSRTKR